MNGTSVTRPVMMRSRVSFATGWMSEGSGPAVAIGIDHKRGLPVSQQKVRCGIGCELMPFATTAPLRREIEARIPERPFTVEFWDGTRLPSTSGDGPDLQRPLAARRRPRAAGARPARARPRLRQRRARGRRHRRGDRAARRLAAAGARRRRQASAAARRRARRRRDQAAAAAAGRAAPQRPPPQQGARRPRRPPPLRRLQRVLRALPRTDDGLQLRDLAGWGEADAGGGAGREARDRRPQARR